MTAADPVDLDQAQALTDDATEGPWIADEDSVILQARLYPTLIGGAQHYNDAEFIAAARSLVPALISELRQAREALTTARHRHGEIRINHLRDLTPALDRVLRSVEDEISAALGEPYPAARASAIGNQP